MVDTGNFRSGSLKGNMKKKMQNCVGQSFTDNVNIAVYHHF